MCVKKVVKTKSGRKVRKKICRKRRVSVKVAAPQAAPTAPAAAPLPAPSAPVETASGPVAVEAPVAAAAPACVPEESEWLSVTAYDLDQQFRLKLSRTCLRAGRTLVQYRNDDAQDHDLQVEGVAPAAPARTVVARVAPDDMEQAELQLAAGTWRLYCSIPGHGSMSRTLTVTSG